MKTKVGNDAIMGKPRAEVFTVDTADTFDGSWHQPSEFWLASERAQMVHSLLDTVAAPTVETSKRIFAPICGPGAAKMTDQSGLRYLQRCEILDTTFPLHQHAAASNVFKQVAKATVHMPVDALQKYYGSEVNSGMCDAFVTISTVYRAARITPSTRHAI